MDTKRIKISFILVIEDNPIIINVLVYTLLNLPILAVQYKSLLKYFPTEIPVF